jgi:large subunit ribosomal protein L29
MVLKTKEIRGFTPQERLDKLEELKRELMHERGVAAMGGSPPSPGKIRQLRTSIARILTIMREKGETVNE